MKRIFGVLAVCAALWGPAAEASTGVCGSVTQIAATSHEYVTSLGTNCAFTQAQPAVSDLQNIAGDTVLGNPTGSSGAVTATTAPVLGIAGTSTGSVGLSSSGGGTVTLSGGTSTITSYSIFPPVAAPTSNGQAWTSTTGGVGSWSSVIAAAFTVTSETTAFNVTSGADWTRYDNAGASGSVTGTLPASPSAGDNWCFLVAAAQTFEVLANTGETINVGGVVSASAGNMQSNTVGASACMYFESTTKAYVYSAMGPWSVT